MGIHQVLAEMLKMFLIVNLNNENNIYNIYTIYQIYRPLKYNSINVYYQIENLSLFAS